MNIKLKDICFSSIGLMSISGVFFLLFVFISFTISGAAGLGAISYFWLWLLFVIATFAWDLIGSSHNLQSWRIYAKKKSIQDLESEQIRIYSADLFIVETITCESSNGFDQSVTATRILADHVNRKVCILQSSHSCRESVTSRKPTVLEPKIQKAFFDSSAIISIDLKTYDSTIQESTGEISGKTGSAILGTALFGVAGGIVANSGKRTVSSTTTTSTEINGFGLELRLTPPHIPYIYIPFYFGDGINPAFISSLPEFEKMNKTYSFIVSFKENIADR